METQPLWLRRFVALGLLLCVVLAGLLYVVIPLVEASDDLDRRIESRQDLNARLSERSFDPKAFEQQTAEIKASLGKRRVYLKAGTVALASVELGEYLQSVITKHRARLQSRQSLGKQVDGPLSRVAERIALQAEIGALQKILHDLEARQPFLFVENLNVQRQARSISPNSSAPVLLNVRFELAGYMLPDALQ